MTAWSKSRWPRVSLGRPVAVGALLVLTACASSPNSSMFSSLSKIHASNVPNGSLRVGQVVYVAKAEEVRPGSWGWDALRAAEVPEAEITAGSIVVARVFCCGGEIEQVTAPAAHVPHGMQVALGDFIEIWSDRSVPADTRSDARPNRVTRVLQTASSPRQSCSWQPDKPYLWMRVAYCDWMPAEGWIQQAGAHPFWVKVAGAAATG